AQRTQQLRFGPMVYALPLYHPLRLLEEICMLDQLSRGRLEIGFGRGASQIEVSLYGQDPARAQDIYNEARALILQGLTAKTLTFEGRYFTFKDIPLELEPFQKPHPPLWYGVHSVDSATRAAAHGLNIISLDSARDTRAFNEKYRQVWSESRGAAPLPKLGISRFVVIAEARERPRERAPRLSPVAPPFQLPLHLARRRAGAFAPRGVRQDHGRGARHRRRPGVSGAVFRIAGGGDRLQLRGRPV